MKMAWWLRISIKQQLEKSAPKSDKKGGEIDA